MSSIQLPSFIPWIIVGTGNGLIQGWLEIGFNTQAESSWPIRGLLYGMGGILALLTMDLVAMLFPSWRASQGLLPSNKAKSFGRAALASITLRLPSGSAPMPNSNSARVTLEINRVSAT